MVLYLDILLSEFAGTPTTIDEKGVQRHILDADHITFKDMNWYNRRQLEIQTGLCDGNDMFDRLFHLFVSRKINYIDKSRDTCQHCRDVYMQYEGKRYIRS